MSQKSVILWVTFVVFAVAQIVWLTIDKRPVVEERHYFAAARIAHTLRGTDVGRAYPDSGNDSPYPPLLAYYTGAILAVTRCNVDVAVLSLLPFAWLLLWSVWKTGQLFFSSTASAVGAALVLCFHHFIDVEPLCAPYTFINEYMIDLPLSAMLATAFYLLIRVLRDGMLKHKIMLGLIFGLALLIKVSAPLYLLIVVAGLLIEGYRVRSAWISLWLPTALAAFVALPWYLLNFGNLATYFVEHEFNAALALRDGMPMIGSVDNFIYYLTALKSIFSTPFVFIVLISTILIVVKRKPGWRFIVTGIFLSYLILTMLWGKSWRFLAPCLIFHSLAVAGAVDILNRRGSTRRLIVFGLVGAACLRIILMHGAGSMVMTKNTTLQQEESEICGLAPVADDGGIDRIMQDIMRERDHSMLLRISVVPYLRRFRHASFMQNALKHNTRMAYVSEWLIRSDSWREELERSEFIITKTGYNGSARFIPHRARIEDWLQMHRCMDCSHKSQEDNTPEKHILPGELCRAKSIHLINEYQLPDGTVASLFKQDRTFATWQRLPTLDNQLAHVNFGNSILLTDCELEYDGSNVLVSCTWQTLSVPAKDHRLFIQIRRGWHNLVARSFTPGNGLLPIIDWKEGERLAETYSITLPLKRVDEDCELWLGWHRGSKRLPVRTSRYPKLLNAVKISGINDPRIRKTHTRGNSNSSRADVARSLTD